MEARSGALAQDQVGASLAKQAAGGVEVAHGVAVPDAIASLRIAGGEVESEVASQEEQTHLEQAQSEQVR